jgi:hypothetical protein
LKNSSRNISASRRDLLTKPRSSSGNPWMGQRGMISREV